MSAGLRPRRVRIDLAYDGTDFAGWQWQVGQRTVQGVVEGVLGQLQGGRPVRLRAAGRTDAGVHARGQVADGRVATRLDDPALCFALDRLLPADVRAMRVVTVDEGFHAQRDAVAKVYRYRLDLSRHGDPLGARYALHHPQPLDVARVQDALSALPGTHDWSGFTTTACRVARRVRTMAAAAFDVLDAERAAFTFAADGFLRYMVRNLVGTALLVGRGGLPVDRLAQVLDSRRREDAGPTAPAHGLCLERVLYSDDDAVGA